MVPKAFQGQIGSLEADAPLLGGLRPPPEKLALRALLLPELLHSGWVRYLQELLNRSLVAENEALQKQIEV